MSVRAEIVDSFQIFGTKLPADIIDKCEEICNTYNVGAEELANQWAAYSVTNLKGAPPTVDGLMSMERKEFIKKGRNATKIKSSCSTPTSVKVYKTDMQEMDPDVAIMDSYSTPKTKNFLKRQRSPNETPNKKHLQPNSSTPNLNFSPASYSSSTNNRSSNYAARVGSGDAVLSYGLQELLAIASFKRNENDKENMISVEKWNKNEAGLPADAKYMYEVMNAKAASLINTSQWLANALTVKYKLETQPFARKLGNITTCGRITCDADGKLNALSVLLENSEEFGRGATISLNLTKLGNYALFPGQVVALEGVIPKENVFITQKIYTDASPELPSPSAYPIKFRDPLQIIVATGPFTLHDNLQYQPLQDLIKYVTSNIPHVLVLIGPFVSEAHEKIRDGTMAETYNDFFENLIECIMAPIEGLNIQVVLVSSSKDVHHCTIFPTPPFSLRKKYPNLQCVSDPSLITIEGLVMGITSTDILFHLGKEEICSATQNGDRMSRLVSHLFSQRNFYPLYPPDDETFIDHQILEQHALLDVIPHLLILPSNLRYFIKKVGGSIVVNPERLVKGHVGGTFTRIQVFPPDEDGFINNNIVAQIVRI